MTGDRNTLRDLFDDTLGGEPPLVDLVPGAVAASRRRTRRHRIVGGVAAAVLALAAGTYTLLPAGSGRPAAPVGRTTTTPQPGGVFNLPGLFDDPGTPDERCSVVNRAPIVEGRAFCSRVLTQLLALFPDDVIVPYPAVDFDASTWCEKPVGPGGTVPGFAENYRAAAADRHKVSYDVTAQAEFAFRGPHGEGVMVYYVPDTYAPIPDPDASLTLSDGTEAQLMTVDEGDIQVSGKTRDGAYSLAVAGVPPVCGGGPGSHETFPDGHTVTLTESQHIPMASTPYTIDELKALLRDHDLAARLRAIGPDTVKYGGEP